MAGRSVPGKAVYHVIIVVAEVLPCATILPTSPRSDIRKGTPVSASLAFAGTCRFANLLGADNKTAQCATRRIEIDVTFDNRGGAGRR
jgi:hypothetical protein